MPNSIPTWLATMRAIDGTEWAPGDGTSDTIQEWLRSVATSYPTMAPYCNGVMNQEYFSWCGLTVAFCMTKAGIAPVFGASDTGRFLWAAAWLGWGTPTTTPQLGDVLVFDFGGGDHHVTLFEKDNGDGTWSCHGGNQSHKVTSSNYPKSMVMGIRRPVEGAAVTVPHELFASVIAPASQRFAACVALVLQDEGGNDDDPRDPGGRTSRGITQREWDTWRQTHTGLPADVWQAPQDQVLAIYQQNYWNALSCDDLPAGVDYAVFDYGVLSGVGRSARVLQGFLGVAVDGEIGPKTIAAATQADAATLIKQICNERLVFMQGLNGWGTYGRGWSARVQRVCNAALAMVRPFAAPVLVSIAPSDVAGIQPAAATKSAAPLSSPNETKQMTPEQAVQTILNFAAGALAQQNAAQQGKSAATTAATPANILSPLAVLLQQNQGGSDSNSPAATQQLLSQLSKIASTASVSTAAPQPLGQVNGALGQTIGNLLDGKKTAIGTLGALLTAWLSNAPQAGSSTGLMGDLSMIASSVPGLSGFTMPLFLALTLWGTLGKLEKWSQGSTTDPKTTN